MVSHFITMSETSIWRVTVDVHSLTFPVVQSNLVIWLSIMLNCLFRLSEYNVFLLPSFCLGQNRNAHYWFEKFNDNLVRKK